MNRNITIHYNNLLESLAGILYSHIGFLSSQTDNGMDEDALKKQIGLKIRQLRTVKNWSRKQIANKLDMSPTGYGCIERGESDMCITRLAQIAEIFEITLSDLLGLTEKTVLNFTKIRSNTECLIGVNPISSETGDLSLKHELERSNLLLGERNKEIELLRQQIAQLQEINQLLKENKLVP